MDLPELSGSFPFGGTGGGGFTGGGYTGTGGGSGTFDPSRRRSDVDPGDRPARAPVRRSPTASSAGTRTSGGTSFPAPRRRAVTGWVEVRCYVDADQLHDVVGAIREAAGKDTRIDRRAARRLDSGTFAAEFDSWTTVPPGS